MAWWEGGGDSWEGKEVRLSATDRLVRGPTVNLAAFRSLRPCTCWILADREGGGVAVEGKCGVRNPQTASWSTPNMVVSPANRLGGRRDRRGYSRPARRDAPPAGVWCVPGWPVTTPPWYNVTRTRYEKPKNGHGKVELEVPGRFPDSAHEIPVATLQSELFRISPVQSQIRFTYSQVSGTSANIVVFIILCSGTIWS